jgi:outer membrane protein assembly factor BamB
MHRRRWQPAAALAVPLSLFGLVCSLPAGGGAKVDELPPHAWPTFGGTPARNMVNLRDKVAPTEWAVEGGKLQNVKWVADLGTKAYGGPVIAGGRVFMGTNNEKPRDPKVLGKKAVLMCFRAADGKFQWQAAHDMPPAPTAREALGDGLCSTPTVEGERVYYVTPAAVVVCAEAATGKSVWQLDMMKDLKVFPCYVANCSPLVVGDLVFVLTGNGTSEEVQGGRYKVVSPKAPSFVALHKKDGTVAWQSSLPGGNIIEGQWSNPAYAVVKGKPQVIFPGGDGYLYGLEPASGKMIWKFNCNPKKGDIGQGLNKMPNYILSTPVVHDGRVYVGTGVYPGGHPSGNHIGHFWCVDLGKTGDVSPKDDNFDPKAPVNKDSALVWHYGGRVMPKPKLGERSEVFGTTLSTAAVEGGLVYAAEERGYLHCLDAATGKKYWDHDFKDTFWGSPYWVAGRVYIGTEAGDVVILAHGKAEKVLATINMDENLHGTPAVVDGVLYVATDSKLYAIGKK